MSTRSNYIHQGVISESRNKKRLPVRHAFSRPLRFMPIYYVLFTIYCALNLLKFTSFQELSWMNIGLLYLLIRIVSILVLGVRILVQRFQAKQYVLCLVVGSCVLASTFISGSWNILLLLLFLIAGREVDLRKIAICVLCTNVAVIFLTVICANNGIIKKTTFIAGNGMPERQAFGFTHPNLFGLAVVTACCAYAVLQYRKFGWKDLLIYGVAFYACYELAYSRTSAISILLIVFLSLFVTIDKHGRWDKLILVLGSLAFLGLSLFSIWLMVYFKPSISWMSNLNSMMTGRLDLMHHYFETYGVHMFGFDFSKMQENYRGYYDTFICDNAFAHVVLESGIVVAALLFLAYEYVLLRGLIVYGELTPELFGLIIFAFVAFSESGAFWVCVNFCLVALAEPFFSLYSKLPNNNK
ncbi:polysaccharide polymerase [Bifidobacterium longum subsp. longum]|nr:polysaccharide polymerase [Bifidobacterium longum subsp. longum]